MTNEIKGHITRTEAQIKRVDTSSAAGSNRLIYLQGKLRDLKALLPKPTITLHVEKDATCEGCQ